MSQERRNNLAILSKEYEEFGSLRSETVFRRISRERIQEKILSKELLKIEQLQVTFLYKYFKLCLLLNLCGPKCDILVFS